MAFDIQNETHLATLRDYGNSLGISGTRRILRRFNLKKHSPTGATGPSNITRINLAKLLEGVTLDAQGRFRVTLMYSADPGDPYLDVFRAQIRALDPELESGIDNLTRGLSYADETFGDVKNGAHERVDITKKEWVAAMNHTGE